MSEATVTPPEQRGRGCLGKGCLLFVALAVLFVIALGAGAFWGIRYLRGYSDTRGMALSAASSPAPVEPLGEDQPSALLSVAQGVKSPEEIEQLERDWKSFQDAAKRHEAVSIELTADDINTLIDQSEAQGQVFVVIANNIGRLRFSVSLKGIFMMNDRFLNGEATVAASPDGDPAKIRISNIVLSGQPVPESVLDQGVFGWPSIHTFVTNWLKKQRIATFRIENNKVTGETLGAP